MWIFLKAIKIRSFVSVWCSTLLNFSCRRLFNWNYRNYFLRLNYISFPIIRKWECKRILSEDARLLVSYKAKNQRAESTNSRPTSVIEEKYWDRETKWRWWRSVWLPCFLTGPTVLVDDTELRCLARSFEMAFSAWSALSSLSSKSCWTLRYLARLIAATSSCDGQQRSVNKNI